jgi:alpha-galactosidase
MSTAHCCFSALFSVLTCFSWMGISLAQEFVLARSPPMGWNSWNHFGCKVSDATIRAQADAMVSSGMKAVGYRYVNIDDCWEGKRDPQGRIHSNEKFPDLKALADYVHSKGLKLGIYSSPGPKTCAGYEGSYAHEEQDAQTYSSWASISSSTTCAVWKVRATRLRPTGRWVKRSRRQVAP